MRWVASNYCLPEVYVRVLVRTRGGASRDTYAMYLKPEQDMWYYSGLPGGLQLEQVSHWMRLSDLPDVPSCEGDEQ